MTNDPEGSDLFETFFEWFLIRSFPSDYFLKSESENALKRLVDSAFLQSSKTATNTFILSSSGIAVFHDLTVQKTREENLVALKLLVKATVDGVGLKMHPVQEGSD